MYELTFIAYDPYTPHNIESWAKVLLAFSANGFKPISREHLDYVVRGHEKGAIGFIAWHIQHGRLREI